MSLPSLPGPTTSLVVDLSHYQATANLAVAKNQGDVVAVLLKATEGATYQDPAFLTLYDRAVSAGLHIGVYHFGTARPPHEQVQNFIATVSRIAGGFANIVPALDLEENQQSPDNTISPDQGEAWVQEFKSRTNTTPLLYAGGYLRDHGGAIGRPGLASCPLWLAEYGSTPHTLPGWQNWTMWQFTDGRIGPFAGSVSGIGRCSQDLFNGDRNAFDAFWSAHSRPQQPSAAVA